MKMNKLDSRKITKFNDDGSTRDGIEGWRGGWGGWSREMCDVPLWCVFRWRLNLEAGRQERLFLVLSFVLASCTAFEALSPSEPEKSLLGILHSPEPKVPHSSPPILFRVVAKRET